MLQRSCCHRQLNQCQRLASARRDKACPSLFTRAVQTKPPTDPACMCSSKGVSTTDTAVCCCLLRTIPSYQVYFNLVPFVLLHGQVYILLSCLRSLDRGPHYFRDHSNDNLVHHAFISTVQIIYLEKALHQRFCFLFSPCQYAALTSVSRQSASSFHLQFTSWVCITHSILYLLRDYGILSLPIARIAFAFPFLTSV